MSDTIFSNKYFVIALMIIIIILLYLYSQNRSCLIENIKRSNIREKYDQTKIPVPQTPVVTNTHHKIDMDNDNYYTLLEFGGDNYGRYNRRKSIINGIPQPLDMRPDLSQCQPCTSFFTKTK